MNHMCSFICILEFLGVFLSQGHQLCDADYFLMINVGVLTQCISMAIFIRFGVIFVHKHFIYSSLIIKEINTISATLCFSNTFNVKQLSEMLV